MKVHKRVVLVVCGSK